MNSISDRRSAKSLQILTHNFEFTRSVARHFKFIQCKTLNSPNLRADVSNSSNMFDQI